MLKKIIATSLLCFLVPSAVAQNQPAKVETQTVYVTKTGSKYHLSTCSYLRTSKIEIEKSAAVKQGFGPCSRCEPASHRSDADTTPQNKATGRCLATTQKGTQCKRKAASAKRYCWQHGS